MPKSLKNKKKSEIENFSDKIIRHFDVVAEQQDKKIDIVLEQHGDIIERLDVHTEMIGKLTEDVTKLTEDVTKLTEDLTKVTEDVTTIKEQVEFINVGLKRKVDVEEFLALQRRVDALEKRG